MKKLRRSPRPPARPPEPPPAPSFAPVPVRARHDGWTPERQTDFLEALAASGCVEEAAAGVGMSRQSAYRLYSRVDAQAFRMAWEAALNLGIRRLSEACYSRALHGEVVPHFYKGELVGEHRRYDNRLAMFLLRYRDPLRYAASLDQMVYSGHPEGAALAFGQALDRAEEAAFGMASDDPEAAPADPPWEQQTIDAALVQAREQAVIEGDAPIFGSHSRRRRLAEARAEHWRATTPADEQDEPWPADAAEDEDCEDRPPPSPYPRADDAPGGDVASPLSPSAAAVRPEPRCRPLCDGYG